MSYPYFTDGYTGSLARTGEICVRRNVGCERSMCLGTGWGVEHAGELAIGSGEGHVCA